MRDQRVIPFILNFLLEFIACFGFQQEHRKSTFEIKITIKFISDKHVLLNPNVYLQLKIKHVLSSHVMEGQKGKENEGYE